jgi:phosphohistidine phosphatase
VDLYLIRHADAVSIGEAGVAGDEERPLSAKGCKQAKALAEALQRQNVQLSKVLTSPLVRTRQTAEGMLESWNGPRPELVECTELEPGFQPKRLARRLNELKANAVALVGHQPDMSAWAAWLIGSNKAQVDFAKAGTAYIACNDQVGKGAGTLVWLVTPDWYRKGEA